MEPVMEIQANDFEIESLTPHRWLGNQPSAEHLHAKYLIKKTTNVAAPGDRGMLMSLSPGRLER
ncbi:MAG: hypothetical protein JWM11_7172 [Planctomycetaceae bacterium]|nr:hypothetical protein [Planctomycetaceae bacterium]